MARWKWIGILSVALWAAGWMAPGNALADDEVKTLEAMRLTTAGDLVKVCTFDKAHLDYEVALAFCYGFFEGGIRYDQAIEGSKFHRNLVCEPQGTTRLQAVEVFVGYMKANPQYAEEGPIDAIFRALMDRWPCPA